MSGPPDITTSAARLDDARAALFRELAVHEAEHNRVMVRAAAEHADGRVILRAWTAPKEVDDA